MNRKRKRKKVIDWMSFHTPDIRNVDLLHSTCIKPTQYNTIDASISNVVKAPALILPFVLYDGIEPIDGTRRQIQKFHITTNEVTLEEVVLLYLKMEAAL